MPVDPSKTIGGLGSIEGRFEFWIYPKAIRGLDDFRICSPPFSAGGRRGFGPATRSFLNNSTARFVSWDSSCGVDNTNRRRPFNAGADHVSFFTYGA